jgi:hypothetical protein
MVFKIDRIFPRLPPTSALFDPVPASVIPFANLRLLAIVSTSSLVIPQAPIV